MAAAAGGRGTHDDSTPRKQGAFRWVVFHDALPDGGSGGGMVWSPSTLVSPHTFVMEPRDKVLITFDHHDLVFHLNPCCKTLHSNYNEQLCMLITNINHIHRIIIKAHVTLAAILAQPGIKHWWVVCTTNELGDLVLDPQVEEITFDQLHHELSFAWTVSGSGDETPPPPPIGTPPTFTTTFIIIDNSW